MVRQPPFTRRAGRVPYVSPVAPRVVNMEGSSDVSIAEFEIAVLKERWPDSVPGHLAPLALPFLEGLDTRERVCTIGLAAIEDYDWDQQSIFLTRAATTALAEALEAQPGAPRGVAAASGMRAALGWGSAIERGLSLRCFEAGVAGVSTYRGIFLDATSQRAIDFPVARVGLQDGSLRLSLLPVHVPFAEIDPVDATGARRALSPPPEAAADLRQLQASPGIFDAMIQGVARSEAALGYRRRINDPAIRAVVAAAGKLRAGTGAGAVRAD